MLKQKILVTCGFFLIGISASACFSDADPVTPIDLDNVFSRDDWRDIGPYGERTKECIAPTIRNYYSEKGKEYGGPPPQFSNGDLALVLEQLPFGDCRTGNEVPNYEITTCSDAISFSTSYFFMFSFDEEYYSLEDGALIYANTYTDSNVFCNGDSVDVSFGSAPTDNCETKSISFCNVEKDMIMSLYESDQFDKIGSKILSVQE